MHAAVVEDVSPDSDFGLSLPLHHQLHLKSNDEADFCSTAPTLSESGLGVVEYQRVATVVNKELAAPLAKWNGDAVVVLTQLTHRSNVQ